MTSNMSRLFNADSLYEQLIRQTIAVESQPQKALQAQRSDQRIAKAALKDFDSQVSALHKLVKRFRDPFLSPFSARRATADAEAGISVSARDSAATGEHTIRVDRLARADVRVSRQLPAAGTSLAALFDDGGAPAERAFTIHVAQPNGTSVALDVAYTPAEGATDAETLTGLAAAIQRATADARADGRLAEGTGVGASVVRETDGTARLSVRSLATGYGGRLTFSDPDGLLGALEVDRTDLRVGAGGGALHTVGTSADTSDLSAAVEVDGLVLYRDTNTISDALAGITLTLSRATGQATTVRVGPDAERMRTDLDAFVKAYNDILSFVENKTRVDGATGVRGAFAGDSSLRGLRAGMRADLAQAAGGALALADLGLAVERDGTLRVADSGALNDRLATDPASVAAFFNDPGGVATRLQSRVELLVGAKGQIAGRTKGVDARIKSLDAQIKRWDERMLAREETLRAQFARLQGVATRAQSQQTGLSSYLNYGYSYF